MIQTTVDILKPMNWRTFCAIYWRKLKKLMMFRKINWLNTQTRWWVHASFHFLLFYKHFHKFTCLFVQQLTCTSRYTYFYEAITWKKNTEMVKGREWIAIYKRILFIIFFYTRKHINDWFYVFFMILRHDFFSW